MRARSLFTAAGVCLMLAACADISGPPKPNAPVRANAAHRAVLNSVNILQQGPLAPPLETRHLGFWVVQSRGVSVAVNYLADQDGVVHPFMQLDIPEGVQLYLPNGDPVAPGDSVYVRVKIDATELQVKFAPHGLVFGGSQPARLRLYWGLANLDLNGDGVVDSLDGSIVGSLLAIAYQATDGEPWEVWSDQTKSLELRYIEIALPHFSGYAVSW